MGKLDDNGLWEGSRMILPEHRERLIASTNQFYNAPVERPELDEHAWEGINELFTLSYNFKEPITVRLFDPHDEVTVRGVVEDVRLDTKRVRISGQWVKMRDVIGVEQ